MSGSLRVVFSRDEIPTRSILRLMTQKMPDYFTMRGAVIRTRNTERESIDNVFIVAVLSVTELWLAPSSYFNFQHDEYVLLLLLEAFFFPLLPRIFLLRLRHAAAS